MAKYKGLLWGDARGKIGGNIFSRNAYGVYVRPFASPVNPNSPAQANIRGIVQNLSNNWRALTPAQRTAWDNLAAQITLTDSLGNPYKPTGQQLYVGNNTNLILVGAGAITIPPPAPVVVPTPTAVVVSATGGGTPALTVAWASGDTNMDAIIYATATYSRGRTFVRPSDYRMITVIGGAGTPAASVLTPWVAKYGPAPAVGSGLVSIRVKLVDINTGFAGGFGHGVDLW